VSVGRFVLLYTCSSVLVSIDFVVFLLFSVVGGQIRRCFVLTAEFRLPNVNMFVRGDRSA